MSKKLNNFISRLSGTILKSAIEFIDQSEHEKMCERIVNFSFTHGVSHFFDNAPLSLLQSTLSAITKPPTITTTQSTRVFLVEQISACIQNIKSEDGFSTLLSKLDNSILRQYCDVLQFENDDQVNEKNASL